MTNSDSANGLEEHLREAFPELYADEPQAAPVVAEVHLPTEDEEVEVVDTETGEITEVEAEEVIPMGQWSPTDLAPDIEEEEERTISSYDGDDIDDIISSLDFSYPGFTEGELSDHPTVDDLVEAPIPSTPEPAMEEIVEEAGEEGEEAHFPFTLSPVEIEPIPEESFVNVPIKYSRFKGADWFDIVQEQEVILAGLGGIGSWVNIFLSRLGLKDLILFDNDAFETHNMSGQAVFNDSLGYSKVEVAEKMAYLFSDYQVSTFRTMYREEDDPITAKVMICGFDNMEARTEFYNMWKKDIDPSCAEEYLFIDGRLTAEMYQIFVVRGDDIYAHGEYESKWLFKDTAADETDCTFKQTSHMAGMIATVMVTQFTNWCSTLSQDNFPRRIPWFIEYNSVLNTNGYEY